MELHHKNLPCDNPREKCLPASSEAILASWSNYHWQEFVSVSQLVPFDRIVITTRNHVYEIIVTSPETGAVLVRGGTAFATFVAANIVGSRGHGTFELGTVAVGLRLELDMDEGRWIVTTPIEKLAVVPAGAIHRDSEPS